MTEPTSGRETLVERLREQHAICRGISPVLLYDEAADALDAAQAEIARLRAGRSW
jgi:hypothetical protein